MKASFSEQSFFCAVEINYHGSAVWMHSCINNAFKDVKNYVIINVNQKLHTIRTGKNHDCFKKIKKSDFLNLNWIF